MTPRLLSAAALFAFATPLAAQGVATPPANQPMDVSERTSDAAETARLYAQRIAALDDAGPTLNAVIAYDPDPGNEAQAINAASLLAARTVLVKDNIETREWPTTAGSLALIDNNTEYVKRRLTESTR